MVEVGALLVGVGLPVGLALPVGTIGKAYSGKLTTTGGTGSVSYTLASGALPGGLKLSTAGAISGTPTAAGTFAFAVTAEAVLLQNGAHILFKGQRV